jgi:N-formylglutamate amidohydrolase
LKNYATKQSMNEMYRPRSGQEELNAGFAIRNCVHPSVPILLSVPHAGRDYPRSVYDQLRLPPAALTRLEDRYADYLARDAIKSGIPTIIALRSRAWMDLNREACDMDQEMLVLADRDPRIRPGSKVRGGLGLIPRRLAGAGDIWRRQFTNVEVAERLVGYHTPYHQNIATILTKMQAQFGGAILLDLHSMPPLGTSFGGSPAHFVVGDLFGKSAGGWVSELLVTRIKQAGYHCQLNHPYSGDYALRRHASTRQNIHTLQLEVDRALYLDAALQQPGVGLAKIARLIAEICHALASDGLQPVLMDAAE